MKIKCTQEQKEWLINGLEDNIGCQDKLKITDTICKKYHSCAECLADAIEWDIQEETTEPDAAILHSTLEDYIDRVHNMFLESIQECEKAKNDVEETTAEKKDPPRMIFYGTKDQIEAMKNVLLNSSHYTCTKLMNGCSRSCSSCIDNAIDFREFNGDNIPVDGLSMHELSFEELKSYIKSPNFVLRFDPDSKDLTLVNVVQMSFVYLNLLTSKQYVNGLDYDQYKWYALPAKLEKKGN